MKGRRIKRMAIVLAAVGALTASMLPQASAVELLGFEARIDVDRTGYGACAYVGDDLLNAPSYTIALTSTGAQSTGAANGIILDAATDSGNPAQACVTGGFDSQFASVTYTLTWTSVLGTTGTLVVTCAEVFNQTVCSPT